MNESKKTPRTDQMVELDLKRVLYTGKYTIPVQLCRVLENELNQMQEAYNLDIQWLKAERQEWQAALHYPECWDTMTYPTFLEALKEIGCSMEDQCSHTEPKPEKPQEVIIEEMHFTQERGFEMRMQHPLFANLVEELCRFFKTSGATNYLGFTCMSEEFGPMDVRIQRHDCKTPEHENVQLKAEAESVRMCLQTIRDEAFGMSPEESAMQNLAAIEKGIQDLRQEYWAMRDALRIRAENRHCPECHNFIGLEETTHKETCRHYATERKVTE